MFQYLHDDSVVRTPEVQWLEQRQSPSALPRHSGQLGVAFFEYCFQVPANRLGFVENGGPFSLIQLKIIQEVISLLVFTVFTILVFRTETFRWNHIAAFVCIVLAVYFVFRK